MINIQNKPEGHRWIELGCGDNPNKDCDVHCDVRFIPGVTDFVVDLEQIFPIRDEDFDGIISVFALEHTSYQKVPQALSECFRILKPGGRIVIVVPNTEAQMEWVRRNQEGWDGKDFFTSTSEILFGTGDYNGNNHRSFWNPVIAQKLFSQAGFESILTSPAGARNTDMVIDAKKPLKEKQTISANEVGAIPQELVEGRAITKNEVRHIANNQPPMETTEQRAEVFSKEYFNGGKNWGGYAVVGRGSGYSDFPVHWRTFNHIMQRKPSSVLEIGAARGYLGKRLEDMGVKYVGLEISKHCHMTRVCNNVIVYDICNNFPWPVQGKAASPNIQEELRFDLNFSCATLEHIPEQFLPHVIKEMARTCRRGLHGVDFGEKDDGFDRSHVSLFSKQKWEELFAKHAPGWPVEIVDKEYLESPCLANDIPQGDGKLKLNIGSYTTFFHHSWINIDLHDLAQQAQQGGYQFLKHDARNSLPFNTNSVSAIFSHHFLEHLSMVEARSFAKDLRRMIKPDGIVRVVVPNAELLMGLYLSELDFQRGESRSTALLKLDDLAEISDGVAAAPTAMEKVAEMLLPDHKSLHDFDSVASVFEGAGFEVRPASFRRSAWEGDPKYGPTFAQLLRETLEIPFGGTSLFVDAIPKVS